MKRNLLAVLAAVSFALLLPAPGRADGLPPHATVAGRTLEEWSAAWWQWAYSFPVSNNPLFDETGALAALGDQGPVFFLAGVINVSGTATRSVTIPEDKFL